MNKIKVLAPGEHVLPMGTKVKAHGTSKEAPYNLDSQWTVDAKKGEKIGLICDEFKGTSLHVYEVDFSELQPLHPSVDTDIPEEGIEFDDGRAILLGCGKRGLTYYTKSNGETYFNRWEHAESDHYLGYFELERKLPKTVEVCSSCKNIECCCVVDVINDLILNPETTSIVETPFGDMVKFEVPDGITNIILMLDAGHGPFPRCMVLPHQVYIHTLKSAIEQWNVSTIRKVNSVSVIPVSSDNFIEIAYHKDMKAKND